MMEVKQNSAVDLNDLLSSKNNGADEVDDAIMTDLSDQEPHDLVNCGLIKLTDETANITDVENGDVAMTSIIKDVDEDVGNFSNVVNSELEDALLAEDDVLPEKTNNKDIESTLLPSDDILAEKAETSNSTTSSSNVRDPGDDLDTLLSKINDIVEDCIDNESENVVSNTVKLDQALNEKLEAKEDSILEENMLAVEEKTDVSNSTEEQSDMNIADSSEKLQLSEETETVVDEGTPITSDLPTTPEVSENVEDETNKENKSHSEKDMPVIETEVNNDEAPTLSKSSDNIEENNFNMEKTEESSAELVQDNKITSNSIEVSEDIKSTHAKITENDETCSLKTIDSVETNKSPQKNEELGETNEASLVQTNDKNADEQTISSGNVGNDESDDEIVFYVDQPPEEEKSKETEAKSLNIESEEANKTEESSLEKEERSPVKKTGQDDDDVVLLLDDDEEEISQSKKEDSPKKEICTNKQQDGQNETNILSNDAHSVAKEKDIVTDNSDNARDDFATESPNEKDKPVDKAEVNEAPEETNSNCSSSSNLLQEAKSIKTVADERTPEEVENEEEEDDGDVELIIGESKDSESLERVDDSEIAPPAKRIRLSQDDEHTLKKSGSSDELGGDKSVGVQKEQESQNNTETEKTSPTTLSTLKRSHDVVELEMDEKSNDSKDGSNKKTKTDSPKSDVVCLDKVEEIIDDVQSEETKYMHDDKKNVKAVPSYEPIRLYPAPKFEVLISEHSLSLDFLKKFRKSFDNMTKQDLEELVMQKVVEAIIHKSEFSEMRELIEKQEKLISAHRTKISELSKQFRDLEMVHNRVVKDIEQRNAQFIMPVKITRAVGLQVYIPNKKSIAESVASTTGPIIPTSPQRPVPPQTSSTTSTSLTPPQRQFQSSQSDAQQQRTSGTASSGSANTGNVRRGCVQKITPIRPVPGSAQSTSSGPATVTSTAYRNTTNHSPVTQPRILNKNANSANTNPMQRPRYLGSNSDSQRLPTQQQIPRLPTMPANSQRVVANTTTQPKPPPNVATTIHHRSESLPSQNTNSSTSSIVDNYINKLTHLTGGNTAVSITPAKPKEKAVIDLTDEDEAPVQSTGAQPITQIAGTQVPRRSLPSQNNSNTQHQYGRGAQTMARVSPANQMANNKNRQMSSLQGQKSNSFTSISTPPGTSITRINVAPNAPNVQRVKYSHPAPLPATPPQAFNPSWKLPPPRPTIRISNLDNGIVISWTMEESMDRHAECVSYQIYAYQETSGPPMVDSWRHVGDVKAMLLPMAVTLTQFQEGQRYYFAVRAVDCHQRYGPFSLPKTWS